MQDSANLRIMVIDDNPKIHQDFIKILTRRKSNEDEIHSLRNQLFDDNKEESVLPDFHIDTANQGQEGFERICKAVKQGEPYALAFVDIRMPPGWDGIETIKHIWQVDPDMQIVICTAYSDYSWEDTVKVLGKKENLLILKKPFDQIAVRQLSLALTKKWQLLHEVKKNTKKLEHQVLQRTKSLEKSLSITRGTLESSIDGILVINKKNEILDFNNRFLKMWGIPRKHLVQKDGNDILESISKKMKNPLEFLNMVRKLLKYKKDIKIKKATCLNGKVIECYSQPYKSNHRYDGRIWSFRDVTGRFFLEEKIKFQASHDPLTGLPNRKLLTEFIEQQIIHSTREMRQFSVIFFDLDRFKLVNDSFSHSIGDELLIEVAKRVKENIRQDDMFARLGGDEFIFIAIKFQSMDALKRIIAKLLDVFKKPFKIASHEIIVSSSIGVSIFPENGKTVNELIRNADLAMYNAKELGGGSARFYSKSLNKESLLRLEMETDLHHAIDNNEFYLCYQPQYDLIENKLVSVEALIRWQHPKKGLILPIEFIPVVEEIGLGFTLSKWVLTEACKQNKIWQDEGLPKIRVAVNLTANEFKQSNLVSMINDILNKTQLAPKYLEIELTENIIADIVDARETILALKELGVSIAIDDFGTGYSSLSYLKNIPMDRIKIDRSFIENIDINKGDEMIIQAIITMADNLNLGILAEGVETKQQLDFLMAKNCNKIQGFYFSKPLRSWELEGLLKSNKKIN